MDQQSNLNATLAHQIDMQTLKFKPKFLGQSPREILSTAHCQACFKFHELKTGRRRRYEEPGLDFLQCYGCGVVVHHYCYGLKTPVNEVATDSEYRLKMFICDKCQFQGPKAVEECAICSQFDGAFKKVSEKVYVHIMCALFSQDYNLTDYETMKIEADKDCAVKKRSQLPCVYCKSPTSTLSCSGSGCRKACHPYCAYLHKIKALAEDEESTFGWKISFRREPNTNEVSVRPLESLVDDRIRKIYTLMAGVFESGNKESGSIMKLMKSLSPKQSKDESKLSKLQQKKKTALKQALRKAEEEMIDVYSLLPDYEQYGYFEDGPVEAECEDHRSPDPLCICQSYFDGSKMMFGCDSCENWFHCACLEVPEEDIPNMNEYFCDRCKNWACIRHKFFQKDFEIEMSEPAETQDSNGIVPQDIRGFWITDYIITAIIFQNKALQTLSVPSEFKQSIKELVESIEYIPFRLDGVILRVLETYYTTIAIEEAFLTLFASQNKAKKALNFSEEGPSNKYGEKRARKFSKLISQLEDIMNICRQEGILLNNLETKIETFISINKWKVDFYRLLGQMMKEESLNDIKSLEERARTLKISPELPERKYLQSIHSETGEWMVRSTNFFWKKNPLHLHKVKDLKNISINGITYDAAIETLQKNMQVLSEEIEAKHSLEELQGFIRQGELLDSNLGESLKILKKEVEEAENLRRELKEKPNRLEDVEEILLKIEGATIRVPEAIEAITFYHGLKKIKLMLENYLRICENAEGQGEPDQESVGIDVKEVEATLEEIERLEIDFGEEQRILYKKVQEIKTFEVQVEQNLDKCVDLDTIREMHKRASSFEFKTEKVLEIEKKYEIVKKMHDSLSWAKGADIFSNNGRDSNQEGSDVDLSFEEDSSSEIEFLPTQSKVSKQKEIEVIEIEDDNGMNEEVQSAEIQVSDPWLSDLIEFYTTWVSPALSNNEDSVLICPKTIEAQLERVQLWPLDSPEVAQTVYKNFDEFQKIISKGLYLNYDDERILAVFNCQAKGYWNFALERLLSGDFEFQEESLMTLEQLARQLDSNGQSENHERIYNELFVEYYQWISTYKALSTSDLYINFLNDLAINENQLQTFGSTLSDLLERSSVLKVDVDEKTKVLEEVLGHLNWANSVRSLLAEANQRRQIDFETTKLTFIQASLIKIPKDCSLYKRFSTFLQDFTLYKEKSENFNRIRIFVKTKLGQISKKIASTKTNDPKKLLELQKQKPTLAQAIDLQKTWQEKGYIHDQEEQEQIVENIKSCLNWKEKVNRFVAKYELQDNDQLDFNDVEGIAQGLNKMVTEMIWLVLRDDEMEVLIHQLEWRFHAKLLMNGKERSKKDETDEPGKGIAEWKKLLKIADKRTALGLSETLLYKMAKEQVEMYNDLMTKISVIKEHDCFLNKALTNPNADIKQIRKGLREEEDIKLLTKKLLTCRINALEGRQYLLNLLEKIFHTKSAFNGLKTKLDALGEALIGLKANTQRIFKSEARTLLIQIQTLPLRLPNEEKFLEEYEEYLEKEKIKRMTFMQEERKIESKEIQPVLKKDISVEEAVNSQGDFSLLGKRTDIQRDDMEEPMNHKPLEEALEENPEIGRKKLKVQNSLDGHVVEQKEMAENIVEKVSEKCRFDAYRKILETLREMKDFDISMKQPKRDVVCKKLEKCLYDDAGEDKLKYKEKLDKLCSLLRSQRAIKQASNTETVRGGTETNFYRPMLEQAHSSTNIPRDTEIIGPSPDSLGSDDETQKRISTRCHSGLCSETGQFNEIADSNFEIDGIYQPECWSSEQSHEKVSEQSEGTTEFLSKLTYNSQTQIQNVVPPPNVLLSLGQLQLSSFLISLPEEKKNKFVTEYNKASESISHLFGLPAPPVLAHHQPNPQTQTQAEVKPLISPQNLPQPLLSSTKSQPFPFVRVQSTGQNLECVRGPFMNVDYTGSLRRSQSAAQPQQRVLAPSILVNTKPNSSILQQDENLKQN